MEHELKAFLAEIHQTLGQIIDLPSPSETSLNDLPERLAPLYQVCNGVQLPIGQIWSVDQILAHPPAAPITPDWVAFGRDRYFSYWLCHRVGVGQLHFTAWDHESRINTINPCYPSLVSMLRAILSDRMANYASVHDEATILITSLPDSVEISDLAEEIAEYWDDRPSHIITELPHPATIAKGLEALPYEATCDPATVFDRIQDLRGEGIDAQLFGGL